MKASTETDLVKQVLQFLKLRNLFCWRQNSGAVVLGSGPSRRFVRFASTTGLPDVFALLPGGRLLCVECKSATGRQTLSQRGFEQAVTSSGAAYVVVRSIDQLQAELDRLLA